MKKICQWMCPRKKKKPSSYDVHEQTFEMDQNIGDIEGFSKHPDSSQRLTERALKHQNQHSKEEVESNIHTTESYLNLHDEIKFASKKNKKQQSQNKQQHLKPDIQQSSNKQFSKQQHQQTRQENSKHTQQQQKNKSHITNTSIKKKVFNPNDYYFKQEQGQFNIKTQGSINGQQFNIDTCKSGTYFIFDVSANIYVDDCQNCFIFAAPVECSFFVRNCKDMKIVVSASQLRMYNCHNSHFSIYCRSRPVLQSSTQIHFSSLQCPQYPQLRKQFKQAKLEPLNNNWFFIHDFTRKLAETHYILEKGLHYDMNIDWVQAFKKANLQMVKQRQQIVPLTNGGLNNEISGKKALIIFGKLASENQQFILNWIKQQNIVLLRTSKNKIANQKYDTISLSICYNQNQQIDLEKVGNPTMITDQHEINLYESKYFSNFQT